MLVRFKNATELEWLTADNTYMQGSWDILAKDSRSRRIFLIPPPFEVLLFSLTLPGIRRHSQLLQAIPFALEEELSEDIESYHFALAPLVKNQPVSVAVVSKASMQRWLADASAHNIHIVGISPAPLLLPFTPPHWSVAHIDEHTIVRTGPCTGFVAADSTLDAFLKSATADTAPSAYDVCNYTGNTFTLPTELPVHLTEHPATEYLRDAARAIRLASINLCQGEYARHGQSQRVRRLWQIAGGLLILTIFMIFINNIVTGVVYDVRNQRASAAIDKIYHAHFPQATSIVAPLARMTSLLHAAESGASGDPYLDITARVAHTMAPISSITLESMQFSQQTMTLSITGKNFSDINTLITELEATGLNVKQQGANANNYVARTQLLITEAS